MRLPVIFRREARVEFDEAADWYEQRRAGRGALFTATVRQVLDRITQQPQLYAEVLQDIREAPIPGYPYCVYYREDSGLLIVLAVFHTSRDPSTWQGRA